MASGTVWPRPSSRKHITDSQSRIKYSVRSPDRLWLVAAPASGTSARGQALAACLSRGPITTSKSAETVLRAAPAVILGRQGLQRLVNIKKPPDCEAYRPSNPAAINRKTNQQNRAVADPFNFFQVLGTFGSGSRC